MEILSEGAFPLQADGTPLWDSQEHVRAWAHTYLYFKGKVFLQVFDDHDKEWKFNPQGLFWVRRTRDVCGAVGRGDTNTHS